MTQALTPEAFLAACSVEPAIFELRPDYRAMLIVVGDLSPWRSTTETEELLAAAEEHARTLLTSSPVEELPHVAAWREAYRAFGAKPQRTRNSLEALTRRAEQGMPRVNALTHFTTRSRCCTRSRSAVRTSTTTTGPRASSERPAKSTSMQW